MNEIDLEKIKVNDYKPEKTDENLIIEKDKFQGKLYIVSTSIGNKNDITLRAVDVLNVCDLVLCEEMKIGAQILRNYNISKELEKLNEHNEFEMVHEIIRLIREENKRIALISDCGTPVMNDPGLQLVRAAISNNIKMEVVPGATSVMTALVRSGFAADKFVCAGFLSREPSKREQEIKDLSNEDKTVVILDTPYRLKIMLEACAKIMPQRPAYLGCALTTHFESNHYGTFQELADKFHDLKFKSEFVLCFEGLDPEYVKNRGFKSEKRNNRYKSSRDGGRESGFRRDSYNKSSGYKGKSNYRDSSDYKRKSDFNSKSRRRDD